jgi:EAL domain-containing protein (putative c-di-GMP-specific phosphodiesterase class I)
MARAQGRKGGAVTVVLADDEPHVVDYLETVLSMEGFVVVGTAADADGAVKLAHHLEPDVVLLDLHMPGGGLSAAQLIGSLDPETRIVIVSADADEPDVLPLLRSGIDGYVVKGCSPDQLAEAIHSVVAGHSYLAPAINKVAMEALTSRLHAEDRAVLNRDRERARISDLITACRFQMVHQPIIDLADGSPMAVEALARFTALPIQTPDVWFDEAERVGLRVPLELATASAALSELARLADPIAMTINISPAVALSGRLGEVLLGRPLRRVVLELTEHTAVTDYGALIAALAPWRRAGVRLAVDDAGGGYASFAHILAMEPDFIKLDVGITRDIEVHRSRRALARALVGFAAEVGADVIAEGMETTAQLEVIKEMGTPFAQGFHLGRPRSLDEQPHLLVPDDRREANEADGTMDLRTPSDAEGTARSRQR